MNCLLSTSSAPLIEKIRKYSIGIVATDTASNNLLIYCLINVSICPLSGKRRCMQKYCICILILCNFALLVSILYALKCILSTVPNCIYVVDLRRSQLGQLKTKPLIVTKMYFNNSYNRTSVLLRYIL